MYIYIYMYVCMHACMHACMHVCMYGEDIHLWSEITVLAFHYWESMRYFIPLITVS